jgi:hypothetical protein
VPAAVAPSFSHLKRPDFFIVGAPKCGTTAMAQYLSSHPDVFMPVVKEMHQFGSDLQFSGAFFRRRRDAYLAEYEHRSSERRAGEASVWYLYSQKAAQEIKDFCPEAGIIIMLRDPVESIYSQYYQFLYDGNEHLQSFEEALEAEDDRRANRRITRHTHFVQGLLYTETVRYTDQVRRYFKTFGRDRVHVIVYDDLAADPAGTYRETLAFLGVDPNLGEARFRVVNPTKYSKFPLLKNILNNRTLRMTAHGICGRLPRKVFTTLRRYEGKIWRANTRFGERPPMSPSTRKRLKRLFAPEVARLGRLLDRDLSHWSK